MHHRRRCICGHKKALGRFASGRQVGNGCLGRFGEKRFVFRQGIVIAVTSLQQFTATAATSPSIGAGIAKNTGRPSGPVTYTPLGSPSCLAVAVAEAEALAKAGRAQSCGNAH